MKWAKIIFQLMEIFSKLLCAIFIVILVVYFTSFLYFNIYFVIKRGLMRKFLILPRKSKLISSKKVDIHLKTIP